MMDAFGDTRTSAVLDTRKNAVWARHTHKSEVDGFLCLTNAPIHGLCRAGVMILGMFQLLDHAKQNLKKNVSEKGFRTVLVMTRWRTPHGGASSPP